MYFSPFSWTRDWVQGCHLILCLCSTSRCRKALIIINSGARGLFHYFAPYIVACHLEKSRQELKRRLWRNTPYVLVCSPRKLAQLAFIYTPGISSGLTPRTVGPGLSRSTINQENDPKDLPAVRTVRNNGLLDIPSSWVPLVCVFDMHYPAQAESFPLPFHLPLIVFLSVHLCHGPF